MNNFLQIEQEKRLLRWGGLAGILGSIVFILVFIVVSVFIGENPSDLAAWVDRFPEIRAARTVENSGYLLVLILWVPHYLSLHIALRRTSRAPALFGSVLGIVGLTVLAAGALPHVATLPLSDLYHLPGVTPADQATLALIWKATWSIFDSLLFTGLIIMAVGITAVGAAMLGSPAFGKRVSWLSIVLGVLGLAAGVVLLIDPGSIIAFVNVLSLILFHLVLGWQVYQLSKTPEETLTLSGLVR